MNNSLVLSEATSVIDKITNFNDRDQNPYDEISKIINYATKGGKCIRGFIVKHIIDWVQI